MTAAALPAQPQLGETEYRRRIWAWTMYDWANSAFATTILAAVLPVYFSQVAGSTLPSPSVATSYWSFGLSISLLIIAVLSPILGTISDVMRGKKKFLAIFAGLGIVATALLVLVESGDWMLASILAILGRIGFNGANTFYDALLPHVAREDDRDRVSARGYAMGYLGGGILLAVNVVMIFILPGTWGSRLSFFSVAVWWAVFSIPLFRHVPEPPAAQVERQGSGVIRASFQRIGQTLSEITRYRQLFKYLLAYLIYNDGIGTIIGIAAIYGTELGFGSVELILALMLVQFVGIPYSLIFGRLPSPQERRRPIFLAFILFNLVALPLSGWLGLRLLPSSMSGAPPAAFSPLPGFQGEGRYTAIHASLAWNGNWAQSTAGETASTAESDAGLSFAFNGQNLRFTYSTGPDQGIWAVLLDGQPFIDPDTGQPLVVDAYSSTPRAEVTRLIEVSAAGQHTLTLQNSGTQNPAASGGGLTFGALDVLPAARISSLPVIIGMILAVELVGLLFAFLLGPRLFTNFANLFDTQRSILLALLFYVFIAIWGFKLDSVVEFWFLAWMVAIVQGGSQALSRSLYAALSPSSKSGEFFGLFGIMEKFSAIIGPLLFALAVILFGSSRPAVLSLVVLFVIGGYLLSRVNVEEGKRVARQEDAALLNQSS